MTIKFIPITEVVESFRHRPAEVDVTGMVDDWLEILAGDITDIYKNCPPEAAWAHATHVVTRALAEAERLGPPGPDDDGGRGPHRPAPMPAPEAIEA